MSNPKSLYIPEFGLIDFDDLSEQLAMMKGMPLWKIRREARAAEREEEKRREYQREMVHWEKLKKLEKKKTSISTSPDPRRYFNGMIPQKCPRGLRDINGGFLVLSGDVGFGVLDGLKRTA